MSDVTRHGFPAAAGAAPLFARTSTAIYHFRRAFHAEVKPERFVVHVSGDNPGDTRPWISRPI
jgi:hypothetical protein